jgi:hypothetical protein
MATTKSNLLATTPLRNWPPQAFMAEAKRTARLWSNHPAFIESNGGLFSDIEDRTSEITVRVLDYLLKKLTDDSIDQVTLFHQIARYCQPGIVQDSYSIPPDKFIEDDDLEEDDANREKINDLEAQQREEDERAERMEKLQTLLRKSGVTERDFALFDSASADFVEATGVSERGHRNMKSQRKNEILKKIKSLKLDDNLVRLVPVLRGSILAQI